MPLYWEWDWGTLTDSLLPYVWNHSLAYHSDFSTLCHGVIPFTERNSIPVPSHFEISSQNSSSLPSLQLVNCLFCSIILAQYIYVQCLYFGFSLVSLSILIYFMNGFYSQIVNTFNRNHVLFSFVLFKHNLIGTW